MSQSPVTVSGEKLDPEDDQDFQMRENFWDISGEINLEVAIRERLAATIEGRIQWALQMLDVLSNIGDPQDQVLDTDDFQDAALDALDAMEAPSSFLFDSGIPQERSPSPAFSPVVVNQPPLPRIPKTRSSRTSQQKKHLYIRLPSTLSSDGQLAVLACPTCNRTQFTTLQGLLNHARLAHGVEWASHDACISACAVPTSGDTCDWESCEKDGVEVPWGGNVVGLRRLFERAVGVDSVLSTPLAHPSSDSSFDNLAMAPSTLLSRTLGLHADSPALAHFLGRAPKRRCIHVYDEDQFVDITTFEGTSPGLNSLISEEPEQARKGFRMHFPHRNTAREDLDVAVDVAGKGGDNNEDNTSLSVATHAGMTASRFHITARIRLEDRSLFLRPGQRFRQFVPAQVLKYAERRSQPRNVDQYRWMLGVTAPSYSLPLSSFLTCVTVVPPKTVSSVFLTARQQPFAIVGTANEPFTAKVILEWVGGGKMEVEHWIELDQTKSHASVPGSEQVLDLELDRNIPLLPVPKGSPPLLPSLDRQAISDPSLHNMPQIDSGHGDIIKAEYYEQVLRNLLPRVPMTAKDVKSRTSIQVPYKLVANTASLLALITGRRKAIEWARARTLHELFVEHMASVSPHQRTELSVGDVYMFLEDASLFPRPSQATSVPLPAPKKKGKEKDGTPALGDESCPSCGLTKRLHPGYDMMGEEGAIPWICSVIPATDQRYGASFPLIDMINVLPWSEGLEEAVKDSSSSLSSTDIPSQSSRILLSPYQYTFEDLVALNPPNLILAVHVVASKLCLPTSLDPVSRGKNTTFLPDRDYTKRYLMPTALLTATLKPFISTLLWSGIEVAKRDAATAASGAKNSRGRKVKKLSFVLTPGHILRGLRPQPSDNFKLVSGIARNPMSGNPRTREAIALCIARLGVRLNFGQYVSAKPNAVNAECSGPAAVKAEPE